MKRSGYLAVGSAVALALAVAGCYPSAIRVYSGNGTYAPPPPSAAIEVNAGVVYADLAAYGTWIDDPAYGSVWRPRDVPQAWQPYTYGHWVATDDYGWLWVSDWPWGAVPFHYGRWVLAAPYGWVWVPGTEWGPGWVAWRRGGGYVGWAPLPPQARWSADVGLQFESRDFQAIQVAAWCFVPDRYFLEPVHQHALAPTANVTVIHVTQNVTNIVNVGGRAVNRGVPPAEIERSIGRPVPRARVREFQTPDEFRRAPRRADEVPIYRPLPAPAPRAAAPAMQQRPAPAPRAATPVALQRPAPAPRAAAPAMLQRPAPAPRAAAPVAQQRPAPAPRAASPVAQQRPAPAPSAATPVAQQRPAETDRQARMTQPRNPASPGQSPTTPGRRPEAGTRNSEAETRTAQRSN